jgi:predicted DsbA family dithiol-disulfide isomerase
MNAIDVVVTSDFICPWCWIGLRKLKQGIAGAGLPDGAVQIRFAPFELNPHMPVEGQDRRAYRTRKFGSWARSQAMDAEVTAAGERVGAAFRYDSVRVTPNTRRAHRLMRWAPSQGDAAAVHALAEAIFAAYFSEGRDIGDAAVLAEIAAGAGFDADAARVFLDSPAGEHEVVAAALQAQQQGVQAVPHLRIGAQAISGAQPAAVLARALQAAALDAAAIGAGA